MNRSIFDKKRLSILGICVILVLFSYVLARNIFTSRPSTMSSVAPENAKVEKVFIKDFHTLGNAINADDRAVIEKDLYSRASQTAPDLFTGTVRPGSYTTEKLNTIRVTTLLIDVYPVNQTYIVTLKQVQGRNLIDIACAPDNKQMATPSSCVDGEYR